MGQNIKKFIEKNLLKYSPQKPLEKTKNQVCSNYDWDTLSEGCVDFLSLGI